MIIPIIPCTSAPFDVPIARITFKQQDMYAEIQRRVFWSSIRSSWCAYSASRDVNFCSLTTVLTNSRHVPTSKRWRNSSQHITLRIFTKHHDSTNRCVRILVRQRKHHNDCWTTVHIPSRQHNFTYTSHVDCYTPSNPNSLSTQQWIYATITTR